MEILRAQKTLLAASPRPYRLATALAIPFVLVLSVEQFRIMIVLPKRNEKPQRLFAASLAPPLAKTMFAIPTSQS